MPRSQSLRLDLNLSAAEQGRDAPVIAADLTAAEHAARRAHMPRLGGRFRPRRRRDLTECDGKAVLSAFKFILSLDAHRKNGRGPKIAGEPEGGVGGQRGLLPDQPLNSRARHPTALATA